MKSDSLLAAIPPVPPDRNLRRVLVISPHFPPTNAPDHQRIRTALPYLSQYGWEAHILAVIPQQVPHPQDPLLENTLPPEVPISRTAAIPARYTQTIGLGNVGWRCLPFFKQEGDRLLSSGAFDLIFFSTTIFPVMTLGAYWQKRFGIPYVLDFQDPWRSDYHHNKKAQPPGGRFKYGLTQLLARGCEPWAMGRVNQVISVSPAYPEMLQRRYPWLRPDQFTILPFGAPEQDFQILPQLGLRQPIFDPTDGLRHWVYVGRGGTDMAIALRLLFQAIRMERDRHPEPWQSIRLHFVGTSYAPESLAVKTIEPMADACGVGDLVHEHPGRIPYFEAQQLLVDSDAILLIGSDDPSYTASKIYPCILAQKPILGLFHEQSSAVSILRQCRAGEVISFRQESESEMRVEQVRQSLIRLIDRPRYSPSDTDWTAFQPYTACEMTRRLCAVFDRSLSTHFIPPSNG